MRRFAEDTSVPIARTRSEIDKLLRDWGALGIQWTDDWQHDQITVRFGWKDKAGQQYMARFSIKLPGREALSKHAVDGRSGVVSERKLAALMDARGKQEHRLLLFWLKAALNAVEAGIIPAEAIFLPFLEGQDGQTVAEVCIPRMARLLSGGAGLLLPEGEK
jgi:hypothetical protein